MLTRLPDLSLLRSPFQAILATDSRRLTVRKMVGSVLSWKLPTDPLTEGERSWFGPVIDWPSTESSWISLPYRLLKCLCRLWVHFFCRLMWSSSQSPRPKNCSVLWTIFLKMGQNFILVKTFFCVAYTIVFKNTNYVHS